MAALVAGAVCVGIAALEDLGCSAEGGDPLGV